MVIIMDRRDTNRHLNSSSEDVLLRACLARQDINLLVKLVEGLGHLGIITTLDKEQGLVLIQTTRSCWPQLYELMQHMPINWRLVEEDRTPQQ